MNDYIEPGEQPTFCADCGAYLGSTPEEVAAGCAICEAEEKRIEEMALAFEAEHGVINWFGEDEES